MMRHVPSDPEQRPGVLIYRPQDRTGESHARLTAAGCRLHVAERGDDLGRAIAESQPVHAMLAASFGGQTLDDALLRSMPKLRIVSKFTIGVDDVDVAAATDLGILVTHCPTEANWGGVAEGTLAMVLALLKKIQIRSERVKAGGWREDGLRGTYLGARDDGYAGITFGIIGLGRVGRRVAGLMAPWRVRLLATDPYVDAATFERYGAEPVPLGELLERSDVVSIHCSLNDETRGLIDHDRIALMRPHAVLINTARGTIVDVDAVCDAIDQGRLAGAAFDVLPEEPPRPGARVLATDDRVILSPHMIAANDGGTLGTAIPWATDAVLTSLRGDVPPRVVNDAAIGRWLERFGGNAVIDLDD